MNIPDPLKIRVRKAVEAALSEVEDIVVDALRDATRKDIASLLGIETRWDGWEFKNPAVASPLQKQVRDGINTRARDIADKIGEVVLTPKDLDNIKKAYIRAYKETLLEHITKIARESAVENALAQAEAIVTSIPSEALGISTGSLGSSGEGVTLGQGVFHVFKDVHSRTRTEGT